MTSALPELDRIPPAFATDFGIERFHTGLNLTAVDSDLRVQFQLDPRYAAFVGRAERRTVLGVTLPRDLPRHAAQGARRDYPSPGIALTGLTITAGIPDACSVSATSDATRRSRADPIRSGARSHYRASAGQTQCVSSISAFAKCVGCPGRLAHSGAVYTSRSTGTGSRIVSQCAARS